MKKFTFYAIYVFALLAGTALAGEDAEVLEAITPSGIFENEFGQIVTFRFKEFQTLHPSIYLQKASTVESDWSCDKLKNDNAVKAAISSGKSTKINDTKFVFKAIKQDDDTSYKGGRDFAFYLPGNSDEQNAPDWGRYKMCIYAKAKGETSEKWVTDKKKKFFKIALGTFFSVAAEFMGIFYFLCWAWAAMPQAFLHYRQKSTSGFSWDYVAISTSTHFIYTVHHIYRHAWYKKQGLDQKSTLIDVFNTSWGLCWSTAKCIQCWYYPRTKGQGLTWASAGTCGAMFGYAIVWLILAIAGAVPFIEENGFWTFVDQLGMIKVGISFIKYTPQVYENWRRKSTGGFHPLNFLLDIGGVIGSFCQYFFLCWNEADPTYITGSLFSTVGLALVSLLFDAIFVYQHFVLYRNHDDNEEESEAEAMKSDNDGNVTIQMQTDEETTRIN